MITAAQPTIAVAEMASRRLPRWKTWDRAYLRHIGALLLFALLALTQAPQAVFHPSQTVVPDLVDPVHHIWSVAVLLHDVQTWPDGLWSLFDANVFYPVPHAAAF